MKNKSKGLYVSHIKPMKGKYFKWGILLGIWIGCVATLIGFILATWIY